MPLLAILMVGLAIYSMLEGDAMRTLRYLFWPDLSQLTARGVLDALGLGFFSIGVGLGLMITYAAYSGAVIDLRQVALLSVLADTIISLLAGLAVFPIVFANGIDPGSGPGLVFVALPLGFAKMPFGGVAPLVHRLQWHRARAVLIAAGSCFFVGIGTALSTGWSRACC